MGISFSRVAMVAALAASVAGPVLVGAQDADRSDGPTLQRPAAAPPPQQAAQPDKPIQLARDLVTVNVTVMDPYGRFVTGLDKSSFEIFDDKVKQTIAFFSDEDAPVSLGILYDVSGSMSSRIARSGRTTTAGTRSGSCAT